jgi:Ni/Fe-hydrogenase subunit HybB-like protein
MEGNITVTQPATVNLPKNKLMWLSLLMIAIGVGGAIYAQWVGHHHAFANTREMPWGMLIGVYAYFAIISTGLCVLAAFSHAFGGNQMAPLANRMVWLSIIMLLGAFTVIGLEIENPWRMPLGVVLHPNVTSNIWWMGTLYGLAIGVMLLELYLIVTKRFSAAVSLELSAPLLNRLQTQTLVLFSPLLTQDRFGMVHNYRYSFSPVRYCQVLQQLYSLPTTAMSFRIVK